MFKILIVCHFSDKNKYSTYNWTYYFIGYLHKYVIIYIDFLRFFYRKIERPGPVNNLS